MTDNSTLAQNPLFESEHNIILQAHLNELNLCGVNETEYNITQFGKNQTATLAYLNQIAVSHNCTNKATPIPLPTPSAPDPPHVLFVLYFVTVMVLGLAVNTCVIGTICRVRKLRTITNCFVLSLAFADLLMAAVVVPLKINELYNQKSETSPFLDTIFPILGVASLLNLCVVTLDRYFTITSPLTYETRVTGKLTVIVIVAVWVISTTLEMLRFAVTKKDEYLFQVIRFVIVFSVPFTCVLFVNAKIYLIARGHARQIRASVPDQSSETNRKNFSKKMKTAQVIGLLVGTFILTWLPYFIITIYEHFNEETHTSKTLDTGKVVCAALACSTALFNPLLYGFLRKEVRIAIIRGLKCENVNQLEFDNSEATTRRIEATNCK